MKSSTILSAALLGGCAIAAESGLPQKWKRSVPFHLVLQSDDSSLHNKTLTTVDIGFDQPADVLKPGQEELAGATIFYMDELYEVDEKHGTARILKSQLTSKIQKPDGSDEYPPMLLETSDKSNVAPGLLTEGPYASREANAVIDGFDLLSLTHKNRTSDDPSVPPQTIYEYKWHICDVILTPGGEATLSWILDDKEPDEASCKKVDVKRQWT